MAPRATPADAELHDALAAIVRDADAACQLLWRTPPSRDDMRALLGHIRRNALRAQAMAPGPAGRQGLGDGADPKESR